MTIHYLPFKNCLHEYKLCVSSIKIIILLKLTLPAKKIHNKKTSRQF